MSAEHDAQESLKQTTRSIADHEGVVSVHPVPGKPSLEIEYDPSTLSEDDLRRIAESHPMGPALQNAHFAWMEKPARPAPFALSAK